MVSASDQGSPSGGLQDRTLRGVYAPRCRSGGTRSRQKLGNRKSGCGNRRFVRLRRLKVNNRRPCLNFGFASGFQRTRRNNDTWQIPREPSANLNAYCRPSRAHWVWPGSH
jgi:hypothetical protein